MMQLFHKYSPNFANMIEILRARLPPAATHVISTVYVIEADIYIYIYISIHTDTHRKIDLGLCYIYPPL